MKIRIAAAALAALGLASGAHAQACTASADTLVMSLSGKCSELLLTTMQFRTAARAMGYGGVAQYAVLPGKSAALRLPSGAKPTFLVPLPSNVQPQGLVTLASLEPRRNGTREVLIGAGYTGMSNGVHPDRVIAVTLERAASQRGAPEGAAIYELTPQSPLPAGEYAVIAPIIIPGGGPAITMSPAMVGRYFDFGVD